jgi:hypothetical protein
MYMQNNERQDQEIRLASNRADPAFERSLCYAFRYADDRIFARLRTQLGRSR